MSEADTQAPRWTQLQAGSLAAGAIGLGVCIVGALLGGMTGNESSEDPLAWEFLSKTQFYRSYLMGFLFLCGLSLGSLGLLMVQVLINGHWGWAIRSYLEAATRTVPYLVLFFLPVLLGVWTGDLYSWTNWTAEEIAESEMLTLKAGYLNPSFFTVRATLCFLIWIGLAYGMVRWAASLPRTAAVPQPIPMRRIAAPGLLIFGLTCTFASVDWGMSIEPLWYSSIYGALFVAGMGLTAISAAVIAMVKLTPADEFKAVIRNKHLRDLGTLMLAFTMLWAYMSIPAQFLLIYSGNLQEEVPYYIRRMRGGWEYISLLLLVGHFAVPFLLLLQRGVKQNPNRLAALALFVLAMRLLDLFWTTQPGFYALDEGFRIHWMDFAAPIGLIGLWTSLYLRELKRQPYPLMPEAVLGEDHHG